MVGSKKAVKASKGSKISSKSRSSKPIRRAKSSSSITSSTSAKVKSRISKSNSNSRSKPAGKSTTFTSSAQDYSSDASLHETTPFTEPHKFTAFFGVFVPTILSLVGVIIFLRLGYIVGSVGILGTILMIVMATSITFVTALSLSSITTNIKIGEGGAYSIISKTLGLEVGGSVGIPMFVAQLFALTLYLFGFSEVWHFLFPTHNIMLVLVIAFISLFFLTMISTVLAIRLQFAVFLLLIAVFVSIFMGISLDFSSFNPVFLVPSGFTGGNFWHLFALFFPGVTGIMAGIGLSGELRDPKREIPRGLLAAVILSFLLNISMAVWYGLAASPSELLSNSMIVVSKSLIGPLVLAGLLAATYSQALTMFISAPRLLHSMAQKSILPGSSLLSKRGHGGVPYVAIIVSSIIVLVTLFLSSLDAVAPIITMFFLLSYTIINLVVFLEHSIGLVSFRPTFHISKYVPLYGAIGSLVLMFFINFVAGIVAILFIFLSYMYLSSRHIKSSEGDIRSGLFIAFSEWAAKKVVTLPDSSKHVWKPNVLLPVLDTSLLLGNFPLIKSIIYPNGTLTVLGLDIKEVKGSPEDNVPRSRQKRMSNLKELPSLIDKFSHEGIFTSSSYVSANDYLDALTISLEAIEGQTFPPNILFLPFKPKKLALGALETLFKVSTRHEVGVVLSDRDSNLSLGAQQDIHVWIPASAIRVKNIFDPRNYDLAMLLAYRLYQNWKGRITLWVCVPSKDKTKAKSFMRKLVYEARFPSNTKIVVSTTSLAKTLGKAPEGDIHIFPLSKVSEIKKIRAISQREDKSFFFVMDSGKEDVLA